MHQLDRFQRFCSGFLGLELEPFQIKIAREMFSDRREALILLPRGNGKSTLLAAIALWHLLSASDPRIAIGAASREQAATLFDSARTMATRPAIASRVEINRREPGRVTDRNPAPRPGGVDDEEGQPVLQQGDGQPHVGPSARPRHRLAGR